MGLHWVQPVGRSCGCKWYVKQAAGSGVGLLSSAVDILSLRLPYQSGRYEPHAGTPTLGRYTHTEVGYEPGSSVGVRGRPAELHLAQLLLGRRDPDAGSRLGADVWTERPNVGGGLYRPLSARRDGWVLIYRNRPFVFSFVDQ